MDLSLSPELSIVSVLLVGFLLGLQHAVEADHLAAVSAIVSERKNILSSAFVGGLWGAGHTISLFAVGVLVIFLKLQISETAENALEAVVGAMLVLLGLNALRKLWQGKLHVHLHSHGAITHAHPHIHETGEKEISGSHHGLRFNLRSIGVGMIHGLAGSAALMLLILPTINSPLTALGFILIFGIGSIGGMMLMSFLIGLPLHLTASRFLKLNVAIRCLAALFSFVLGAFIIYERASAIK